MSLIENKAMSKETLRLPPLVLASGSPRRAEILRSVGWDFEKIVADVDETEREGENSASYVERLAEEKALAVAAKIERGLILGADTTVVLDDEIIGKPIDFDDARRMLAKLSGRWHEVLTGVALVKKNRDEIEKIVDLQRTRVKFANLTTNEIEYLIAAGEPLDKAGAYAVQGVAALFIEEIEGDYWNVVGLPIGLVYTLAQQILTNE